MRLSDAKLAAKPLKVEFDGGGVLEVLYRVPEYTPNQAAALTDSVSKDPRQAAEMLCRFIDSWDLTRDDDTDLPLVPAVVAEEVPLSVISRVLKAVQEDQQPEATEGKASAAT